MTVLNGIMPWLVDALVIFGTFIVTIGVYGIIRMPDTFTRLHAASKAVFLGVITLLVASTATGDMDIILRATITAFFLLVTTPISAHVVARAAYDRNEKMRAPGAIDESGHELNRPGPE